MINNKDFLWICLTLQHRNWYSCMQVEEQEKLLLHVKSLKSWPDKMKIVIARVQLGLVLCTYHKVKLSIVFSRYGHRFCWWRRRGAGWQIVITDLPSISAGGETTQAHQQRASMFRRSKAASRQHQLLTTGRAAREETRLGATVNDEQQNRPRKRQRWA